MMPSSTGFLMGHPVRPVRRRRSLLTIASLMWMVVVAAMVSWLARLDRVEPKTALWVCCAFSAFVVANLYAQSIAGRKCPACDANRVGRLRVTDRHFSYYRCGACGQRLKRGVFGGYWDASGKEDDHHFVPKDRSVKTWDREPIVPDANSPATRTVSSLLQTKWDRSSLVQDAIARGESPLAAIDPRAKEKPRSRPWRPSGVKLRVTEAFLRTMELLRCDRSSR